LEDQLKDNFDEDSLDFA
jgi:hypothetical protein